MSTRHRFESLWVREMPELKTRAEMFRHVGTGTDLLSLTNEDENKVFGVTFRTPPADSTGIAHILEHSVLCGSRKYPVKEPFVELLKSSLKTFLNAMTYPDKTCYPVASQNVKDFYNLIDVYLDAVFYPRLTPHVLQQEGWHYELDDPSEPLRLKGVVFNEMKGAYSSPDSLLAEYSQQSLFPSNPYGFDSGGDPGEIPNLTFEQFKAFHERYYHPSNARVFFYGDDDPEERLRLVNDYLKDFRRLPVESSIPLQERFQEPRRVTRPFPAGEDSLKALFTVNWMLDETHRAEQNLALHMLEYMLLGMPGSPLRKALIDSKLGEDVAGVGLGSELRQMYFSTGLKGISAERAEDVEGLIFSTLSRLVREGIHPHTVEAAQNTIEFILRENNSGSYPRGLVLMLRSLTTWLYDEDPLALVAFESPLEALKRATTASPSYFEGLIDRFLLNNAHRTSLLLRPDPELAKELDRAEKERLLKARSSMTPADLQKIADDTAALRSIQETPDPPQALALIPSLRLSDIEAMNKRIPLALSREEGCDVLYHDLFTSGIVYLDIGFNLYALPQKALPYVPLFSRALLEMGTEDEDFVSLTQRISRKTGGIRPALFASSVRDSRRGSVWLFLRGKAMLQQTRDLLDVLRDVLLKVRLDNRERFQQMVLEGKARLEEGLVPAGHQVVSTRLRALFSEADWVEEQMKGVSQIFFLRNLSARLEENWPEVLRALEEIRALLINRNALLVNATASAEEWNSILPAVTEFLDALPSLPFDRKPWNPDRLPDFEGMTLPAQVNYVGKGINLYELGYRYHGSTHVITRYLRNAWLWEKIRLQGGAYGAFCSLDKHSGVLTFVSYRDPNLIKTIEAFDGSGRFLKELELGDDELVKGIIGTIGDIDQYQLPDAKGYTSMVRHLTGEDDERRQKTRDEILGATKRHFQDFGELLESAMPKGVVKVLGSETAIQGAMAAQPGWLKVTKVL
ncbi:MAG: insulinase family protein [Deltaproteobacteria bacterium]